MDNHPSNIIMHEYSQLCQSVAFDRYMRSKKTIQQQHHESVRHSVTRSLSHSVTQSTSHPSPPEHCNHHQNHIHNHQSFEPIMHPRGSCTYGICRVPGERARSHRQRRARRIYRSTILHERIKQQEQHKPNESTPTTFQHSQGALVRPAASGSVKEKAVRQTTRTYQLTAS